MPFHGQVIRNLHSGSSSGTSAASGTSSTGSSGSGTSSSGSSGSGQHWIHPVAGTSSTGSSAIAVRPRWSDRVNLLLRLRLGNAQRFRAPVGM